ncbi:MAG TPA: LacI family DNA-binding transcriptional regulator, partial [Petrotogaceae bacterium]|nr:LacI family DNA-binding transcriptional regulator [Petrotogaceae bacterium]
MSRIEDVAKLAGVSTATVSRVLNNTSNVSEDTRQKVMKAIEELDYTPS